MTEKQDSRYRFRWDHIGDIDLGRPNLGHTTKLEIYRLAQLCLREVLEMSGDPEEVDRIFHDAGHLAGRHFYEKFVAPVNEPDAFIRKLQYVLKDVAIGIFAVEKADLEAGTLVFTVSEDLDCSGVPETGESLCSYEEGFIAGLLESFFGKRFQVKEIGCWGTGDRTCRFHAQAV